MKGSSDSLNIAGYSVQRITLGEYTLGQIVINKDVSVVFRIKNADDGWPSEDDAKCLVCKISAIRQCADLVCPDVKANDPGASCAEAIRECMELACRNTCKSSIGGSGGVLILA